MKKQNGSFNKSTKLEIRYRELQKTVSFLFCVGTVSNSNSMFLFRTILLSVISLLNEPNTFSPANVDASVMYRKWRDTKGRDDEYVKIIRFV